MWDVGDVDDDLVRSKNETTHFVGGGIVCAHENTGLIVGNM